MQAKKCQVNLDAFHDLSSGNPEMLCEVHERARDGCVDRLFLVFSTKTLIFDVDENDDTIIVSSESEVVLKKRGLSDQTDSEKWRRFVGRPFGWGWIIVNQQGYCDGALLSFGNLHPAVLLEVVASSIEVKNIGSDPGTTSRGSGRKRRAANSAQI